ncbi:hypothetical protein SCALM49S_08461 [Streptomyces californicus]
MAVDALDTRILRLLIEQPPASGSTRASSAWHAAPSRPGWTGWSATA